MIGVCGAGDVGSEAVLNLLKEFENVNVLKEKEFILTYFPGGIEDLEYHLMEQNSKFFSSDIAIKNFIDFTKTICHNNRSYYYKLTNGQFNKLVDDYIKGITQIQWKGRWMYDDYVFCSIFKKIRYYIYKKISFLEKYTYRDIKFSIKPEKFYYETEKLLKKIYNYNEKEELFVLDQPFPSNDPLRSMKLYGKESKAIIVLRDPRDIYVETKINRNASTWLPMDDVYDFIDYYKMMFTQIKNPNIMYIHVEDLALNYDETLKKIIDFCGLKNEQHIYKNKYYSPNNALKWIKLFEKFKEYTEDIEIIEKEMFNHIYLSK